MGEGLSLGEVRDAAFALTGAGTWVGKPAYLAIAPLTIQEGQWIIAQAITECWIEARGLWWPCLNSSTLQPFRFYHPGDSPPKNHPGDASFNHQPSPCRLQRGQNHDWHGRDLGLIPPQPPSSSLDHRFESDRSSVLTASLVSSLLDRSEGSQHSQHGRQCRETRTHMMINLPIFKDEDAKDAVTYQSWRWDLMVYHHVGCRDCTLLPYIIWSLQGYPGELVQSLGTDITLDDVLTILDKHYNNLKALDALNQELFQLQMADEETVSNWGVCLSDICRFLAALFPECFPPDCVAELKYDHFYGGLPKCLKAMVAYLKASPQEKTYSDYLWTAREAEKEDSMELSQSPQNQMTDKTSKPRMTSFFSLKKLKGTQPALKTPATCLVHLEEDSAEKDKEAESEDPDSIDRVTEEFMVHLVWAVKDAQMKEKCCYHCSSLEHFICNCPLVRASRANTQLNCKEGTVPKKGAWAP